VRRLSLHVVLLLLIFNSCAIEKRTFNRGYFVHWNKNHNIKSNKTAQTFKDSIHQNNKEELISAEGEFKPSIVLKDHRISDDFLIESQTNTFPKNQSKVELNLDEKLTITDNFSSRFSVDSKYSKKHQKSFSSKQVSARKGDLHLVLLWSVVLLLLGILLIVLGLNSGVILGVILSVIGIFTIIFSIIFFLIFLIGLAFSRK
jgi:hypothetical protein